MAKLNKRFQVFDRCKFNEWGLFPIVHTVETECSKYSKLVWNEKEKVVLLILF